MIVSVLLPIATPVWSRDLAPAGSVLCSTSDGVETRTKRKVLSCNFNGVAGGDGGLQGRIMLKVGAALPSGGRS
jgi:hypothetical protein